MLRVPRWEQKIMEYMQVSSDENATPGEGPYTIICNRFEDRFPFVPSLMMDFLAHVDTTMALL